jgi:RHS repeat-associated protein
LQKQVLVADTNLLLLRFGEIAAFGATTFWFISQHYDADLGLSYYKRRYYAPRLGRFRSDNHTLFRTYNLQSVPTKKAQFLLSSF